MFLSVLFEQTYSLFVNPEYSLNCFSKMLLSKLLFAMISVSVVTAIEDRLRIDIPKELSDYKIVVVSTYCSKKVEGERAECNGEAVNTYFDFHGMDNSLDCSAINNSLAASDKINKVTSFCCSNGDCNQVEIDGIKNNGSDILIGSKVALEIETNSTLALTPTPTSNANVALPALVAVIFAVGFGML